MRKLQYVLLLLILVGAFAVRLYRFDSPIADWHSWRQSDTSAVSRNLLKYNFDLLHPRFDDLSNVPSGKDNPNGYRFVEFPIYNIFQAGAYSIFRIFTIEQWGRLVTIFSSVLSTLFIYLLVKKYASNLAGFLAAFSYAFLPFNIYFGRVILPDPSMVMTILGGIYFFDKWIEEKSKVKSPVKDEARLWRQKSKLPALPAGKQIKNKIYYFLSVIFVVSSLLIKPYALFFTLPIFYLIWVDFGLKFILRWKLWLFAILSIAPLVFWRYWMQQYPEGIPVSDWLFNGGNIRFKPSFFYWLFADRLGRLILGYWGIGLFVFGLIRLKQNAMFFLSFLLSSLLYLFVIARGNVQHDYYQILIIPSIAMFLGLGADFLIKIPKEYFNKTISYALLVISTSFTIFFGWYFVRDFFNINNRSIIVAGSAVDRLTPKNAKILAIYDGDTSLLYQTKRQGWASFEKSIPEMIKMGATHLVFVNTKESDYELGKEYKILKATADYILFDLRQKP